MPILHSTKNLEVVEPPTDSSTGVGVFEYTDHFSLFHYGRMPNTIPGKGEAVCRMAVRNFQLLEEAGAPTHFRRFIPPNRIEFDLAHLPTGDQPAVEGASPQVVPVQVLFRNELPQGSSVHRRLASGAVQPQELGLPDIPKVGDTLREPIYEYATMYQSINRFINRSEAQRLAGLDDHQFQTMHELARQVNTVLTAHAREVGLNHSDGKVEFLVSGVGDIVVADSPGTPDESRLLFNGVHCGKQVLRNWYVREGLEVPVSMLIAKGVPREQWPKPEPLPPEFVQVMSDLYRALSEAWTGERLRGAPTLSAATKAVARVIGQ